MEDKSFEKLLISYREKVNSIILEELKSRKPKSLYNPLIYFLTSGGKRLRSILLLLCAKATDDKSEVEPFNQAVAIELLHNFTLIHDDIMDNSEKRHNKLTVHKKYDLSTAILSGDALLSIAYDFLTRDLSFNVKEILEEFTKSLQIVCEGQALDKEFEIKKRVSLNDYYEMISKKTGALIKYTCRIGALTKTDDDFIVDKLGEFGETMGVAFQIQDDLLDVIGDEKVFGKRKGSDLVEGKKTYLLVKAFEIARGKDLENLKKLVANKGIKASQIKNYIQLYERLGIIDLAKEEIQNLNNKANSILNELENTIITKDLKQFLSLVINRQH